MDIGAVVGGGVVLLVMIGLSVYAAVTLPADAQVPVHHGIGGYNNWMSKNVALVLYPASGVVILLITAGVADGSGTHDSAPAAWILPIVLLLVAASEYGAIRAATRRSRGGD